MSRRKKKDYLRYYYPWELLPPVPPTEVEWVIKPIPREGNIIYFECHTRCGKSSCRFTTGVKGHFGRRIWMGCTWTIAKGTHIADYRKAIRKVEEFHNFTSKLTRSI